MITENPSKRRVRDLRGLDDAWLAEQPAEKRAGHFLTALGFNVKITDRAKSIIIGVEPATYHLFKIGKQPISLSAMLPINTLLRPSETQFAKLNSLAAPFRRDSERALSHKEIESLPIHKRGGALLRSFRVGRFKTIEDFCLDIEKFTQESTGYRRIISKNLISVYENGHSSIPKANLLIIKSVLKLTDDEFQDLDTNNEICKKHYAAMRATSTKVGAAVPTTKAIELGVMPDAKSRTR